MLKELDLARREAEVSSLAQAEQAIRVERFYVLRLLLLMEQILRLCQLPVHALQHVQLTEFGALSINMSDAF